MTKLILTNDQSISLGVIGYTNINGRKLFKKSRHDNILQADKVKQHGDIIAENLTSVFILNPFNS